LRVLWLVTGGEHRSAVMRALRSFQTAQPRWEVQPVELDQADYKARVPQMLAARPAPADVMFWFAGERLREFVRQGQLAPLGPMARVDGWAQHFQPALMAEASDQGELYGLPLSTYLWGFLYRRSAFAQWGVTPPRSWADFLALCRRLQALGVAPLVLGAQDGWAVAGWFDQFNLRLHGRDFHAALMRGTVPYTDPKLRATFMAWRQLLDLGAFHPRSANLDWRQAVPYLSRNLSAMMLMGGFAAGQFPRAIREDLGWFPFPALDPKQPPLEEAPLDLLVVPRHARNLAGARALLQHMAQAEVQGAFNAETGMLSPHLHAPPPAAGWMQASANALQQARGLTQFFDRDSPSAFSGPAMAQLQRFVAQPARLDEVLAQLEALRQKHY
jgi:multiple sugar transport system substrate-binding protein